MSGKSKKSQRKKENSTFMNKIFGKNKKKQQEPTDSLEVERDDFLGGDFTLKRNPLYGTRQRMVRQNEVEESLSKEDEKDEIKEININRLRRPRAQAVGKGGKNGNGKPKPQSFSSAMGSVKQEPLVQMAGPKVLGKIKAPAKPDQDNFEGLIDGRLIRFTRQGENIKPHVYKLKNENAPNLPKTMYFKPNERKDGLGKKELALGFSEDDPKFAQREAAADLVAKKLGIKYPEVFIGQLHTEGGIKSGMFQAEAQGTMAGELIDYGVNEVLDNGQARFPMDPKFLLNRRYVEDIVSLQVFDYLIGNTDRHVENYMVDEDTGKVEALDSELSFPAKTTEELKKIPNTHFAGLPEGAYPRQIENAVISMSEEDELNLMQASIESLIGEEEAKEFVKRVYDVFLDIREKNQSVGNTDYFLPPELTTMTL